MDTFGRVIAWGVMLIVMITIVSAIEKVKTNVKEGIEFAAHQVDEHF